MTTSTKIKPVRFINITIAGVPFGVSLFKPNANDGEVAKKLKTLLIEQPIEKVEEFITAKGIEFVSVKENGSASSDALTDALAFFGVEEEATAGEPPFNAENSTAKDTAKKF